MPMSADQLPIAYQLSTLLREQGYRVDTYLQQLDNSKKSFNYLRQKNPRYSVVCGENGTINLQTLNGDGQLYKVPVDPASLLSALTTISSGG